MSNTMIDRGPRAIGLTEEAITETLHRYPQTDPGALVFFAAASGLLAGKLTDADFVWARKVRDEWAAARGDRSAL